MHSTSSMENCPSAVTPWFSMPSFSAGMFQQLVGVVQQATDVGADLHVILAARLAVQHAVVGNHFVDLQRRHADALGHFLHQFVGDRPDLILRIEEHRNHRRALAPGGIALEQLGEPGFQLGRECHGPFNDLCLLTQNPCCRWRRSRRRSACLPPCAAWLAGCRNWACACERGTAAPCRRSTT